MIRKPMKAPSTSATIEELKAMDYPIACSAKLDGIRGVKFSDGVMSNSLKKLGNEFMQKELSYEVLDGFDGELVVGLPHNDLNDPDDDVFNRTSGNIRRSSGEPDFKFYVFDDFTNTNQTYQERWLDRLDDWRHISIQHPRVVFLEQHICHTWPEAVAYEAELIAQGYEGMMARSLSAPYKEGRVTMKEGYIIKRKPLAQDEAVIVDCFEQEKNNNIKAKNELGDSFRTSHKDNKEGKDTLGGFTLRSPLWKETFNCGIIIGGTIEWRQKIWNQFKSHPEMIIGKMVTYIYQEVGSIDKPRQPTRCKAEFRGAEDMTDY